LKHMMFNPDCVSEKSPLAQGRGLKPWWQRWHVHPGGRPSRRGVD